MCKLHNFLKQHSWGYPEIMNNDKQCQFDQEQDQHVMNCYWSRRILFYSYSHIDMCVSLYIYVYTEFFQPNSIWQLTQPLKENKY